MDDNKDTEQMEKIRTEVKNGHVEQEHAVEKKIFRKHGDFFQAVYLRWILGLIGVIIVLLLVFQAGAYVGYRRANHAFQWGDNYNRTFGGPRGGFLKDFSGRDMMNGHGTAGSVAKIDANSIVIKDSKGIEQLVNVSSKTSIKSGDADIKLSDLKVDERVVVIGSPANDGSISAEIIRAFPDGTSTKSSGTNAPMIPAY